MLTTYSCCVDVSAVVAVDVRRCSTPHIIVGEGGGPGKEEEGRKKLLMNRSTSGGVTPGSGGAECWANKVVVRITAIVHGCHMLDTVGGEGVEGEECLMPIRY